MDRLDDRDIFRIADSLLGCAGRGETSGHWQSSPGPQCCAIASDGSTRRFWRINRPGLPACVIAAPGGTSKEELAESRSAWKIGTHLFSKGVGVPEVYGWDPATGTLVFEDLGDIRLHKIVEDARHKEGLGDDVLVYYRAALDTLATMQVHGAEGFDFSWCWDTSRYDFRLMVDRESGYFLRAFWQGILQQDMPDGVEKELVELARITSEIPADFFLHRDFQSRNIMVKEEKVRIIDYQGGRYGPLAYDLASLLIDPYSNLPQDMQDNLVEYYLDTLSPYHAVDKNAFMQQFELLAFHRNVQIIGAFSYLYSIRKKPFFKNYLRPSLLLLERRMRNRLFADYPKVNGMVQKAVKLFGAGD